MIVNCDDIIFVYRIGSQLYLTIFFTTINAIFKFNVNALSSRAKYIAQNIRNKFLHILAKRSSY